MAVGRCVSRALFLVGSRRVLRAGNRVDSTWAILNRHSAVK